VANHQIYDNTQINHSSSNASLVS